VASATADVRKKSSDSDSIAKNDSTSWGQSTRAIAICIKPSGAFRNQNLKCRLNERFNLSPTHLNPYFFCLTIICGKNDKTILSKDRRNELFSNVNVFVDDKVVQP
jgi:hypothetical protein